MKKVEILFLSLILISGIFLYSIYQNSYSFVAPDEALNKYYSEIYSDSGKLFYQLNESTFDDLARLRGTYILDDKIVPLKFLGFPFILGTVSTLSPKILFLITPLFAVLTLLILFKISYLLTNKRNVSYIAMFVLLLFPFFWYWANHSFFENILSTFFFIFGFYYLLKIFSGNEKALQNYLLLALFFGVSFLIRYDMAILMASMSLPFVVSIKKLKLKWLFLCIAVFLLVVLSTLLIYKLTYGEFLLYGTKIMGDVNGKPIKDLTNVITNYKKIFLFFPLIAFILIPILRKEGNLFFKVKTGMIVYFLVFSFLFFSEFSLSHPNTLHESFTRYALGFYILASLLLASFAANLNSKKLTMLFIMVICVFSIIVTIPIINSQWRSMQNNQEIENRLLKYVGQDDFLIVSGEDKFLYKFSNVIPLNLFKDATTGVIDYDAVFSKINLIIEKNEVYVYCDTLKYKEILNYLDKYAINYSEVKSEDISCLIKLQNETQN